MNEQELRQAMRATMAIAPAPPPMSETPVLDAARRAERRRRARWAGLGSAAAAVAVVGIAVVVVAATSGTGGNQAAGGAAATSTSSTTSSGTQDPTEPSWPDGQTDRTAASGPRYDRGVTLLDSLAEVVPPGYESPPGLKYEDPAYAGAGYLRAHQAQYADTIDGVQVWEYSAQLPVVRGKGVGQLYVEVTSPGNAMSGEGCALAPPLWGMKATCAEHTVGGQKVGVFTPETTERQDFASWAGYRYDDGTVVFVAQSAEFRGSGKPGLAGPPLPAGALAALAADPRFRLD